MPDLLGDDMNIQVMEEDCEPAENVKCVRRQYYFRLVL